VGGSDRSPQVAEIIVALDGDPDGEARAYRVGSTSVLTAPHVIKGAMSVRVRFTSREIRNRIMISGRRPRLTAGTVHRLV